MRKRLLPTGSATFVGLVAVLAVVGAACGGGDDENAAATRDKQASRNTGTTVAIATTAPTTPPTTVAVCTPTKSVEVSNTGMGPKCASVAPGTTVTWTWNNASLTHSVTSDTAGLFDSGVKSSGTFEYTFNNPGTYAYYCTVHGKVLHNGTIEVK